MRYTLKLYPRVIFETDPRNKRGDIRVTLWYDCCEAGWVIYRESCDGSIWVMSTHIHRIYEQKKLETALINFLTKILRERRHVVICEIAMKVQGQALSFHNALQKWRKYDFAIVFKIITLQTTTKEILQKHGFIREEAGPVDVPSLVKRIGPAS